MIEIIVDSEIMGRKALLLETWNHCLMEKDHPNKNRIPFSDQSAISSSKKCLQMDLNGIMTSRGET